MTILGEKNITRCIQILWLFVSEHDDHLDSTNSNPGIFMIFPSHFQCNFAMITSSSFKNQLIIWAFVYIVNASQTAIYLSSQFFILSALRQSTSSSIRMCRSASASADALRLVCYGKHLSERHSTMNREGERQVEREIIALTLCLSFPRTTLHSTLSVVMGFLPLVGIKIRKCS